MNAEVQEPTVDAEVAQLEADLAKAGPVLDLAPPPVEGAPEPDTPPKDPPQPSSAPVVPTEGNDKDKSGAVTPPPPPPAAPSDEIPALPAGATPKPSDWEALRSHTERFKKEAQELRRIADEREQELEKLRSAKPTKPSLTDEQVFEILVQSRADQTNPNSKTLERQALETIREMSSADLLAVISKARAGTFGDNGQDILAVAKDALVEVQARESQEAAESQRTDAAQRQFTEEVKASTTRVIDSHPEMKTPDSGLSKSYVAWQEKYVGKVDGGKFIPGPLAPILSKPDWPEVAFGLFISGHESSKVGALNQQIADLTKQLDALKAPGPGGRIGAQTPSAAGPDGEIRQLEQDLAKLGSVG